MAKTRKKSISELGSVSTVAELNAEWDMLLDTMAKDYNRGWNAALDFAKRSPSTWRKLVKESKLQC